MVTSKRLLAMARKWQKVATLGRRRIMSTRINVGDNKDEYSPSIARRGHIFVYSTDGKRFMIPIAYVTNSLFRELLRMSEEEFGLPSDGPIIMPCDASYMDYIISILKHGASIDGRRLCLCPLLVAAVLPLSLHDNTIISGLFFMGSELLD